MKDKKQSIGIVMIAAAMAALLIAGTILAPTQASATSQHSKSGPQFNNSNKIQTTILTLQILRVPALVSQTHQA